MAIRGPGHASMRSRQRAMRGSLHAQIRNLGWHVRQLGLAAPAAGSPAGSAGRKAARFATADHRRHAVEARQQLLELRLHLEHDLGAGARQHRRVAHELDGVAQALLGVQQDGLVRQAAFAEPGPLAKPRLGVHSGALPAPFILLKAAPVVADGEQSKRLVEVRVGIVRRQLQRLSISVERLAVTIERHQRETEIDP